MKILFAIKSVNHKGGGAERVLSVIASALSKRNHTVYVLSFDKDLDHPFYPLDPAIIKIGLALGDVNKSASVTETIARIFRMRKQIRLIKPDVVIGFMHSMFIPAGLSLIGTGIPVIGSEHIVFAHYRTRKLELLLLKLSIFFLKKIVTVSEQANSTYPENLRKEMVAIQNPVGIEMQKKANVDGEQGKKKILLTIGRLSEQKDHITLIRAFALIAERFPDWILHIVGDGELQELLDSTIEELNMSGRIFLKKTTKDISAEYSGAQLFVIPSLYESFGLVIVEAFLHGLPAIGFTDCEGTNKLILHNINGLLVQPLPNRVEGLRDGLQSLMGDEEYRIRLAQNCKLPAGYDTDSILASWEKLIGDTVA